MRRFQSAALAALAVIGFASVASAADMPTKMPVKAAPMVAATPWTGFYINGGIGYGIWAADTHTVDPTGACNECTNQVQGGKGWLGVIGAGFDYQFTPKIVAGVFGDFNISNLKGTVENGSPFYAADLKQTSAWAAGGRVGWLTTPMVMSYLNGGFTAANFPSTPFFTTFAGVPSGSSTPSFTAHGWFLGGGVEASITQSWFLRTEYRYAYYGWQDLPELTTSFTDKFKPTVQTVTTQLVYKFNHGHIGPTYAAMPAAIAPKWTGIYVSAGAGYGIWAADTTTVSPVTGACVLCANQVQGGKGWLSVVGAGYDWQFAPAWVAGVLGDFNISSLKGSIQDQGPVTMGEIKQTSAWAAGARVGWLPTPAILAYVNGGYSGARFSGTTMVFEYSAGPPGMPNGNTTPAFTANGWFLGGGMETKVDLLGKGWFWRNEYRYASYSTHAITDTGSAGVQSNIAFKPTVQTVTSEIVFKFN